MTLETPFFDALLLQEKEEQAKAEITNRKKQIAEHRRMMKLCWPNWNGPKIDSESADGYISVGTCIVYSITHGQKNYHAGAPCRVIGIEDDGETIIAEIEYKAGCICQHYNGELLRLDILEIWPPTHLFH